MAVAMVNLSNGRFNSRRTSFSKEQRKNALILCYTPGSCLCKQSLQKSFTVVIKRLQAPLAITFDPSFSFIFIEVERIFWVRYVSVRGTDSLTDLLSPSSPYHQHVKASELNTPETQIHHDDLLADFIC